MLCLSFLFKVKDPGTNRLHQQVRGQRGWQHEAERKRDRCSRSTGCWMRPTKVLDTSVQMFLPFPAVSKKEDYLLCSSAKVDPHAREHSDAPITSLTNVH